MCKNIKKKLFKLLILLIAFILFFLLAFKVKEINKSERINTDLKEALFNKETIVLSDIMVTGSNTKFILLGPYQSFEQVSCSDYPLINPYITSLFVNEDKCRLLTFNSFFILDIVTIDDVLITSTFNRPCFPSQEVFLIPNMENDIPVSFRIATLQEIGDTKSQHIANNLKSALKKEEPVWLKEILPYEENSIVFFVPPYFKVSQIDCNKINKNETEKINIPTSNDEDLVRLLIINGEGQFEILNFFGSYESPLYYNEPGCFSLKNVLLIPDFKRGNLYFKMINKETF